MGKLFGFNVRPDFALIIFLAGLGILTYGLIMMSLYIADAIEYADWYDWDYYDISYLIMYSLCIVGGLVLAIAGFHARKGKGSK